MLSRSVTSICLVWILITSSVQGQSAVIRQTPELYIVGLSHAASANRNADSLLEIARYINPDLILVETDILSGYFRENYQLVAPPHWYRTAGKLKLAASMPPEMEFIYNYRSLDSQVLILPFDMAIPNRKKYIRESGKAEYKLLKDLNKAFAKNEIADSLLTSHFQYVAYSNWLVQLTARTFQQLNDPAITDSIRQMMSQESSYLHNLFQQVPRLKSHKAAFEQREQHWRKRNETMATNILRFIKGSMPKRVLILTGLLHKYYLEDLLKAETRLVELPF